MRRWSWIKGSFKGDLMQPILIISAVPQEIELLQAALINKIDYAGAIPHLSGSIGNVRLVICAGGIGKINAAIATSAMIERYQPALAINTGCAGAYPGSGLEIGNLALATAEILGDEGAITSAGWLDLREMNLPLAKHGNEAIYNLIPVSDCYAQKAVDLAAAHGIKLVTGNFVSLSTCSGTSQRGEVLTQRFQAIAESMEGAAVALASLRYGIDCLEIRGISNYVEERNLSAWEITKAVRAAQQFVLRFLKHIEPEMIKH